MKTKQDGKTNQEHTSTYFNDILKKDVTPLRITDLPDSAIAAFDSAVAEAFPDEAETTLRRVRYLIPYILQAIDWDQYGLPLEGWQLKYYYRRDRFEEKTGLTYQDFLAHEFLMKAVETLGLDPEPTYEFLLFLKYYFDLRSELRYSPLELLGKLKEALRRPGSEARMDVTVDGKHFKFENGEFVKALLVSTDTENLKRHIFTDIFEEGALRDKTRALDYYLIKTLLDYLPTQVGERRGRFSQAERDFALSVLHFCGRLTGEDVEGICSFENNATFDKLMRDFKDIPIPFAMELFL